MIAVASIAAGIQFGWALQLSLLTPYVQLLGVPYKWAANIWLCGPISGMIIQPLVRSLPFIFSDAIAVAIAVFLIGYAADLGHAFGDDIKPKQTRPRAVVIFVTGFWILDVAKIMLEGPCRALISDLAAGDQRKMRTGNGLFSFFMAVGSVLGYAAGSRYSLKRIFIFTETKACNLKTCFFFSIFLLTVLSTFALIYVKDVPLLLIDQQKLKNEPLSKVFVFGALKELKKPMWILMIVTAINWIAWFPFFLYNSDWMGREVYGGTLEKDALHLFSYLKGVRASAIALMLNAVLLGLMSLAVEPLGRLLGGAKRLWGIALISFLQSVSL